MVTGCTLIHIPYGQSCSKNKRLLSQKEKTWCKSGTKVLNRFQTNRERPDNPRCRILFMAGSITDIGHSPMQVIVEYEYLHLCCQKHPVWFVKLPIFRKRHQRSSSLPLSIQASVAKRFKFTKLCSVAGRVRAVKPRGGCGAQRCFVSSPAMEGQPRSFHPTWLENLLSGRKTQLCHLCLADVQRGASSSGCITH